MSTQVLMIVVTTHPEDVDIANNHENNFNTWTGTSVMRYNVSGGLNKQTILNYIRNNMQGSDRVIYIDDHSALVDGAWGLDLNDPPQNIITYDEIDGALGPEGNRAYFICRGSGSGEAALRFPIARPNRNVFCSMHDDERLPPPTPND